ncbi:MAG: hypothetical protein PHE46_09570 [Bacteroidales bacterium]|nr:hypothetical protein [Bacteroidales bacterium]MDD4813444.1 hypothetical protein [Bacteroidales bacterium]
MSDEDGDTILAAGELPDRIGDLCIRCIGFAFLAHYTGFRMTSVR